MIKIGFTGHRILPNDPKVAERLTKTIEKLIEQGAKDFYAGGAIGWDTLCAQTVLKLRETHHDIHLHLVLPCPPVEQSARWNDRNKAVYDAILEKADSTEIVSPHYSPECMKKRNERLADLSQIMVCYCTNIKKRSGSAQTIRSAQSKNAVIINLAQ